MRKATYDDKYFFDNKYWILKIEKAAATKATPEGIKYEYAFTTTKWGKLMDTVLRKYPPVISGNTVKHKIITPEMLADVIENNELKRTVIDRNKYYVKKKRPQGYLTVKERKEKAARVKALTKK